MKFIKSWFQCFQNIFQLEHRLMLYKKLGRFLFKVLVKCVIVAGALLVLCEYLVYPVVLLRCSWPAFTPKNGMPRENETLRAMFLADTHLLGPFRGHWFDKLRREWQMHRSFQTAMQLFEPEAVFFLGDVFDEGKWVDANGFGEYLSRFQRLFSVSENGKTRSFVVTGNHDMGFHYEIIPYLHGRFNKAFNTTSVRVLKLKGSKFLLLNSMAMEMDGCFLCKAAVESLKKISKSLQCEENPATCVENKNATAHYSGPYSSPILLQHFPMYRPSDALCTGEDTAPENEKSLKFREKYDCLSKESSQLLLKLIKPRLILSGHTHHHCVTKHLVPESQESLIEYSVPSFSWRNRNDPSFYLAIITPDEYHLSKCYLPKESTIYTIYAFGAVILVVWLFFGGTIHRCLSKLKIRNQFYKGDRRKQ